MVCVRRRKDVQKTHRQFRGQIPLAVPHQRRQLQRLRHRARRRADPEERLGFKLAGTPRHADIVVVSGPVTAQSKDRVLRTIEQVPDPKVIVTLGSCPRSCNVFKGSYSVVGPLDKYVDIDVSIAGCAPKPEAIIDGLALATQILKEKRGAKE